ncbi:MAG: hypothetical protein ABW195_11370, partial [Ilumatobacteraceae bacterium]
AARLAQKGKGKKVRFQGGTLFPMLILAILVIGLGTIVYARSSVPAADASAPTINDHWHVAYGFDLCDTEGFVKLDGALEEQDATGNLVNTDFLRTGVHSHDDGVIHWHPSSSAAVGKRATLGVFLENYGVELTDDSLKFPENQNGGKEYIEGETKCADGKDGELSVTVWDSPTDTSDGQRYISGFDDVHVDHDGMVFTIAFTPRGATVTQPPWAANLEELGAVDQAQGAPTSTVAGGSTPSTVATTGTDATGSSEVIGATDASAPTATSVAPSTTVATTTAGG